MHSNTRFVYFSKLLLSRECFVNTNHGCIGTKIISVLTFLPVLASVQVRQAFQEPLLV